MLKEFISKKFSVKEKDAFCYLPKFRAEEWHNVGEPYSSFFREKAEKICEQPIPQLTATMFLDYYRTGSRSEGYEPVFTKKRNDFYLLIAGQLLNPECDFMPTIIDYVWSICEETSWTPPSHNNHYYTHYPEKVNLPRFDADRTYVDLYSGYTGAMLALVYYFFEKELDEYSPLLNKRIIQRVYDRIVYPILNYDDFGWMGLSAEGRINNWNPWIAYNGLFAAMCLPIGEQERRLYLNKTCLILDQFINYYQPDGGCDEGPGYFFSAGCMLIAALDLISYLTDGEVSVFDRPLIQNMGQYAEKASIFDDFMAAFGDNGPTQNWLAPEIYFLGKTLQIDSLKQYGLRRGAKTLEHGDLTVLRPVQPQFQLLKILLYPEMKRQLPGSYQYQKTWLMEDTMILTARQNPETCMGFSLAVKGGHNDESHNHNDVGQVIICLDKKPVAVDPGSSVYCEKTFSDQRYEIPNMQSAFHNLPTVNGQMQKDGKEFCAEFAGFRDTDETMEISYQIGKAYPKEAGIDSLKRTVTLDRIGETVAVRDDFSIRKGEIVWNLILYGEPEITGDTIKTKSGCVIVPQGVKVEISSSFAEELDQVTMKCHWDEPLYRVQLKGTGLSDGTLTLLFQRGC